MQLTTSQPTPDYGKIASEMRALGHIVWIGGPNEAGDLDWHDGQGIVASLPDFSPDPATQLFARTSSKRDRLRRLRHFIREVHPDIVQMDNHSFYRLLPLNMPRDIQFILDMRQINEQYGTNLCTRFKAVLNNKSRNVFSRYVFDRTTFLHEAGAQKVLGKDWKQWACVVPMGVDPQFLDAEQKRNDGVTGNGNVEFIYIGRLSQRRQLECIMKAAAQVRQKTSNFKVVFMGYDVSEGFYTDYINRLNLGDIVTIRPPIPYEEVPEAVLNCDVALAYVPELPVDWKYHPTLKILEYRALGMPVIATDFFPNQELIDDGVNGLLVQNNAGHIAQAMLRFIEEPDFLARVRHEAKARREGLTWDHVTAQYLDLYTDLLTNSESLSIDINSKFNEIDSPSQ
ncbi:MAG: glycosyltransferase family 4 protein [Chloroflexota bacterium]